MDTIRKNLLKEIAGLEKIPEGAFNLRENGGSVHRNSTANIQIQPKKGQPGIDIYVSSDAKKERVDIPVILTKTGLKDLVYNDFYISPGADVTIVAGCGIHNAGELKSEHDGIHSFHVGKNAHVLYIEKHYGEGEGTGERILNPSTVIEIDEGGSMEMETAQIKGVDSTVRKTEARLAKKASLVIRERIMTHGHQTAETRFTVFLDGEDSSAHVISRSVATEDSEQHFFSEVNGNARCSGHTECDAIIVENGRVSSSPKVAANHAEASLIHEAVIGRIAGEQLIKLMTLGLTEKEAEEEIINGFLK